MTKTNDTELLRGLRKLCGYVENGTQGSVFIYQDDATREWTVSVDQERRYHAPSFEEAIQAAMDGERVEDEN